MARYKLLFISANRFAVPYPVYPLGISYLLSYLQDRLKDFEIRVVDLNLHSEEELVTCLKQFQPDFTGVSLRNVDDVNSMSREFFLSGYRDIVNLVRSALPQTTLIIGGSAFSIFPEELFDYFQPDYGIYGEGEESLYHLLTSIRDGIPDLTIEGLVFRNNGQTVVNPRKHFLRSLDLSFSGELTRFYWEKSGMINLQTKRGCPYNCIYCTYPLIEGRTVRTLDPDKIIESLKDLYFNENINYLFFTDSVFNINRKFNLELARKILKSGIKINWGAYFSPHNISLEELLLFAESGLTHIEFGTESLSGSTLKKYRKHFTVEEIVEVSELCNEAGIYFAHFLILGGYGETERSIDEGFENSKRIHNSVFFPYVGMRIYPGTPLHELAVAEHYIDPGDKLIEPAYYLANGIDYGSLKERADRTGKRWVFPDEDVVTFMNRMRKRNRKGSLWHHLKR
ncbi:MAG: radical SAM protein [Bacteroidetes bacterium]|nr:MAG: radical SAM protein [Bacteroidota bacterium]